MLQPTTDRKSSISNSLGNPQRYTFLLYISLVALVLVSVFAANKQMVAYASSLFDIDYGFGPVIRAIVQQHRLGSINPTYGWWCYACRMPVIPLLGAASFLVSPKASVFMLLKNLIFWPLWLVAFFRLKRRYQIADKLSLVTVLCLLLAPYDLSIAGRVNVEEGFLFALLALLFSLLLTIEGLLSALFVGVLIASIYLTKSSMLPLCAAATVWAFVKNVKTTPLAAFIPVLGLALAVTGWGSYMKSVSGVFAAGSTSSSWNGWNFYKGNNPYAYALYPDINLDTLDRQDYSHRLLPFVPVHSEWELNSAQLAMGEMYVKSNPRATLRMDLKKLFVACCYLGEAPSPVAGQTRPGVMFSNLVNHSTVIVVFSLALFNTIRRRVSDAEVLAVLLTMAILLPYLGGFLYTRHLVPMYGLMAMTLAVQLTRLDLSLRRPQGV